MDGRILDRLCPDCKAMAEEELLKEIEGIVSCCEEGEGRHEPNAVEEVDASV